MTDLSSRLASGDTLYGTFLGLGSALAAEACALAGFDWLLTDLEHGGGDESELLHQQLAADAHGVPMLVRVESTHRIRAGHALDLGAAGIMFPGIESADQAHEAIRHLRYPRTGTAASPPTTGPTDSVCTPNGSPRRTSASWVSSRSRAGTRWNGSKRSPRCPVSTSCSSPPRPLPRPRRAGNTSAPARRYIGLEVLAKAPRLAATFCRCRRKV